MSKLIITRETQPALDVTLDKERMTIGRRPHNDIVLVHSSVSGEHAVVVTRAGEVVVEDVGSTNGILVNGRRVERQRLVDGDIVSISKFELRFVADAVDAVQADQAAQIAHVVHAAHAAPAPRATPTAFVEVLTGVDPGKRVALDKPVTTLGSPGVLLVVIVRADDGFLLRHVDGASIPLLNDQALLDAAVPLADGDVLELTGTRMVFRLLA